MIPRRAFHRDLLAWFARNRRDLPWRNNRTPYRIWISELMLQQTRVDQVEPYFHRWTEKFPTLKKLAAAPLSEIPLGLSPFLVRFGRRRVLSCE